MDYSNIFRIANLAVGVIMVLGGVGKFIVNDRFNDYIIGIYVLVFGLATVGLEFQIPPYVGRYASFYFSFLGRGLFYIFVGTLILQLRWYNVVPGAVVAIIGVGYAALEFVPSIEPPANMREADQGWGAEQV